MGDEPAGPRQCVLSVLGATRPTYWGQRGQCTGGNEANVLATRSMYWGQRGQKLEATRPMYWGQRGQCTGGNEANVLGATRPIYWKQRGQYTGGNEANIPDLHGACGTHCQAVSRSAPHGHSRAGCSSVGTDPTSSWGGAPSYSRKPVPFT